MKDLDCSNREDDISVCIQRKSSLYKLYLEYYLRYLDCQSKCPKDGISLEIGSGAGFLKKVAKDVVTTDVLSYEKVDMVMHATAMPFKDC